MTMEVEEGPSHQLLRSKLLAWFPAIATVSVMLGIIGSFMVTWPDNPSIVNGIVVEGIVVTVNEQENTVQYGYPVGEGPRMFRTVPIGEGTAHPGYRWSSIPAGSRLRVVYDPNDPAMSMPYLDFPVWTSGAWATVVGFVVAVVSLWIRRSRFFGEPADRERP